MHKEYKKYDIEEIYCVGNGKAAAYIKNGNIIELFAPFYTMPPVLSMNREANDGEKVSTYRLANTGIYQTVIEKESQEVAVITDFTASNDAVYVRNISCKEPISFKISSGYICKYDSFNCRAAAGYGDMMFYIREGTPVHGYCNVDKAIYCRLIYDTDIESQPVEGGCRLTFPAGESRIMFIGGDGGASELDSFYNCMALSDKYTKISTQTLFEESVSAWYAFSARIKDFSPIIKNHPREAELREIIDNVAVCIKTQTSEQGGVLAGMFYHLAYGRDMYGVIRGYLLLGLYEEARKCIEFFITEFRKRGRMPNAVGMGAYGSHCWENDDVEQTGYYLMELTDYYNATGDSQFIKAAQDYIEFLLEAQERNLMAGMLPFNGDETYIAGNLLPRTCITNGSMEATALYITGAERILDLCEELSILSGEKIAASRRILKDCMDRYEENFVRDGYVAVNNPHRVEHGVQREYIHGVCLGCFNFDYLKLTEDGGYLCMHCYGHKEMSYCKDEYRLDCAQLMTGFVNSKYPSPESTLKIVLDTWQEKLDHPTTGNVVGYENGLLLYVLASHGIKGEMTDKILDTLLDTRKSGGVWSEYYRDGKVSLRSCPHRPWESAINLCGIIKMLEINTEFCG